MTLNTSFAPWWMKENNGPSGFVQGMQLGLEAQRLKQNQAYEMAQIAIEKERLGLDAQMKQAQLEGEKARLDLAKLSMEDAKELGVYLQKREVGERYTPSLKTVHGHNTYEQYLYSDETKQAEKSARKQLDENYNLVISENPSAMGLLSRMKRYSPEWTINLDDFLGPAREKRAAREIEMFKNKQDILLGGRITIEQEKTKRALELVEGKLNPVDTAAMKSELYTLSQRAAYNQIKPAEFDARLIEITDKYSSKVGNHTNAPTQPTAQPEQQPTGKALRWNEETQDFE